MKPKREIMNMPDMQKWKKSAAYSEFINFVKNLNDSVKTSSLLEEPKEERQIVRNLLALLETLSKWIDEIPPIQQPQRFGNKAFRDWTARLKQNAESLVRECLSNLDADNLTLNGELSTIVDEISSYLTESFGNETRIDYGTGHEMAFLMFVMCLYKVGAVRQEDSKTIINKVFHRYILLVRKLQTTYNMEPAGSHGVWSLDDYQFLPFIFGSSQLIGQTKIEPIHFVEQNYIDMYADEYMFFSAIKFITIYKHGPFAEHSNQLWNISSLSSWHQINGGLIKMYIAEILDKFPVVQHVLFGTYVSIAPAAKP